MAFDDDEILQDYIARLLTVQDTRETVLDDADLQAVARDLGLSERDLARAEAIAESHRQRGKNFARYEAWDEAITEYRQAMVLDPFDVPLLYELAVAHASRYEATHQPEDRAAAYTYAQRCTQLDPDHQPSFALVSVLGKTRPLAQETTLAPARNRAAIIAVVVSVLVGGVMASYFLGEEAPQPRPSQAPEATHIPAVPAVPDANTGVDRERQVPVNFAGAEAAHLQLDVQRSQFNDYDSSFAYKLHATLLNQQAELHRLRLTLDLLDAENNILTSKPFDMRAAHHPPLRPGDTVPIGELIFEKQPPPAVASARLSVAHIEREPAASEYGTATQVPLVWDVAQPAIDIELRERESSLRTGLSKPLHFLTFALHNNGPRTVKRLRIQVTWLTEDEAERTSNTFYAVTSAGPGLQAGSTWVVRTIGTLPNADGYDRYAVHVVEAE